MSKMNWANKKTIWTHNSDQSHPMFEKFDQSRGSGLFYLHLIFSMIFGDDVVEKYVLIESIKL